MPMLDEQAVIAKLKEFFHHHERTDILTEDQPLELDSLLMLLTITYVEEHLAIKLDPASLDFDAFNSLKGLTAVILQADKSAAGA